MIDLVETNLKHANGIFISTLVYKNNYILVHVNTSLAKLDLYRNKIPGNSNLFIHNRGCRVTIVTWCGLF